MLACCARSATWRPVQVDSRTSIVTATILRRVCVLLRRTPSRGTPGWCCAVHARRVWVRHAGGQGSQRRVAAAQFVEAVVHRAVFRAAGPDHREHPPLHAASERLNLGAAFLECVSVHALPHDVLPTVGERTRSQLSLLELPIRHRGVVLPSPLRRALPCRIVLRSAQGRPTSRCGRALLGKAAQLHTRLISTRPSLRV